MNADIDRVLVEFDTRGSLPMTHRSQGSDMGLFGGLLGWNADEDRLPDSETWLRQAGIDLTFEYGDLGDPHPSTYRLTLHQQGIMRHLVAISTGGGMFEVIEIDGVKLSIGGDYDVTLVWFDKSIDVDVDADSIIAGLNVDDVKLIPNDSHTIVEICSQRPISDQQLATALPLHRASRVDRLGAVLPVRSRRGLSVPYQSCAEMMAYDADRDTPLWRLAVEYEKARSGLSEDEVLEKMCEIVRIVRRSIHLGLQGTEYADRVLGYQSGGFRSAMDEGRLIDGGVLNKIVLYTTALMEVKSSMGVIVAAPTAGACAAFPATCLAIGESMELEDVEIARGMMAGGMIGVFIATHWSFAAEVGGCQAEGGSASAMSAAALVTYLDGTLCQATGAASMAMQSMLGLICDPVANRVEVPCLGKNVLAASNALSCANMQLAGYDAVIPMDETIAAAKAVAERMPREHRCTSLGGLAITPTSIAIQKRLESCAAGCTSPAPRTTASPKPQNR
jgi:L-serine dehydratase